VQYILAAVAFANCVRSGCHSQCRCLSAHAYLLLAQEAEQLRAKVTPHMQSLLHEQKTTCITICNAAYCRCSMALLDLHTVSGLPKNDNALSLQAGVSAKSLDEQPQDKVTDWI